MDMPTPRRRIKEPYDASDPDHVAQAEAAAAFREDQRRGIETALMGTVPGREWMWQLLNDCHVFETRVSMTGEHENGFFEGQREVGLSLVRRLARTHPELFARMVSENDA